MPLSDGSCHQGAAPMTFRTITTPASGALDRLVPVQVAPHPPQKPLVTPVGVVDRLEQLVIGQPSRIGQRLPQLCLEHADLLVVRLGRPCPVDEIRVAAVVGLGVAVGRGHGDQRRERPVRVLRPVRLVQPDPPCYPPSGGFTYIVTISYALPHLCRWPPDRRPSMPAARF